MRDLMAAVAGDMNKQPADLDKFTEILENEFIDTVEAVAKISDAQWK